MIAEDRPELTSADAVFEALGGMDAVLELTGARYKTAHVWKQIGSFPSKFYVLMTAELERRGYSASPDLWDMRQPARASA